MNQIVFLEPNRLDAVPFTTSDIIAECADVQHHAIQQLITKHKADFEEFGILAFKMREINGRGQPAKTYCLNEEQATLLITYLKNTEPVRAFKKELVRQFYAMRTELQKRQIERETLRPILRYLRGTLPAEYDFFQYWRSFAQWCEEDSPTDKAIVLYTQLFSMFNRRGWKERAIVNTQRLMLLAHATNKVTAYRARDALVKAGLLEYQPGKKGKPSSYRLLIRGAEKPAAAVDYMADNDAT